MGALLHTPWNLDCGSIVMGGEVVASRVAPEAATREEVAAIHALIVAGPEMLAVLKRVEADLAALGAEGESLKSIRGVIAKAERRS